MATVPTWHGLSRACPCSYFGHLFILRLFLRRNLSVGRLVVAAARQAKAHMKYGIFTFPTEYSMRADHLAGAVEERGFESLWLPEHTHIPVARRTPYPAGGELPKDYVHIVDPFIGLSAAAAVTKRIKLGTAICLVV